MAQRLTRRRGLRGASTAAAVAVAGALSAGCSNGDALGLARQACAHVQRSITIYRSASSAPDPAEQQARTRAALDELRRALPLAATAAGEAPEWQALMTTISESDHIPESVLVGALEQQCADASAGGQPPPPTTSSTAPETTPT